MASTVDPATTLSVVGFFGMIRRDGFLYSKDVGFITVPIAVLGPYLNCALFPSLGAGVKVTLKAVFSK